MQSAKRFIALAQPVSDLREQGLDLLAWYGTVGAAGIKKRAKQAHHPVELCTPLRMKLDPDPPTGRRRLLQSLDHSIWGESRHLETRCQRLHGLVMHGQHSIESESAQFTPPFHRKRQTAVRAGKLNGMGDPGGG